MSLVILVVAGCVAAVLSFALTPGTIRLARLVGAMDQPGDRKVHANPIPRLGGIAVITAAALGIGLQILLRPADKYLDVDQFWLGLVLGLVPIVIVSVRDDIRPVRPLPKLLVQLTGASIAVALGIRLAPQVHLFNADIHIGWLAVPISILWFAGVTNAFNIVDGLDGLSGGLALISAISLGAVSIVAERPEMATASFVLAGALIGFLPYNIHPARVFLGDTGATAIGFTLAAMALGGGATLSAGMAILVPILVLGLPIAETVVSIARRGIRRLEQSSGRVMEADRNHFHHRLLTLGLTHRQAVYVLYGAGLLFAACAVLSMFLSYRNAAMLLVVFIVAAFIGLRKLGYEEFAVIRRGTVLKAYDVPVLRSTLFVVFADLSLVVGALYVAFVLKYDDVWVASNRALALQTLPIVIATTAVSLVSFRVYRASWRSASVEDLMRPSIAIVIAGVASWMLANVLNQYAAPLSVHVIHTVLLVGFINGSRASYRVLRQWNRLASAGGEPILIYGAGTGGTMALREIRAKRELRLNAIGFLDDDPRLEGRYVNGLPVIGSFSTLDEVLATTSAVGIVIATDKLPSARMIEIASLCEKAGRWTRYFSVRMLPEQEWDAPGGMIGPRIPVRTRSGASLAAVPHEQG